MPALRGAAVAGTYAGLRPAGHVAGLRPGSDAAEDYQIEVVRSGGVGAGEEEGGGRQRRAVQLEGRRAEGVGEGGGEGGGGDGGGAAWVTVGAIRSTGLTASLGIARHVARLCETALPDDERAALAARVAGAPAARTTPLPAVYEIVASFRERGDGTVVFGQDEMGFGPHYVTHPLTRAGFARLAAKGWD